MVWEALASVLIGLAGSSLAVRQRPERFPDRALTLATGPAGGLVGAVIMRVVLGPGYPAFVLAAAVAVSAAAVSLLVREPPGHRSATAPARPRRSAPEDRPRPEPPARPDLRPRPAPPYPA